MHGRWTSKGNRLTRSKRISGILPDMLDGAPVFVRNYIAYLTISCGGSVLCDITSNR